MMFRSGRFALLLATGVLAGSAAAQTPPPTMAPPDDTIMHPPGSPSSPAPGQPVQLQLTAAQRTAILNAVRKEPKGASPVNFVASVGAPVPPSIELYILPDRALAEVPEAKIVKYTTVQNQIVLVDPTTMRVVEVLRE